MVTKPLRVIKSILLVKLVASNYYMVSDVLVASNVDEINKIKCTKFFPDWIRKV